MKKFLAVVLCVFMMFALVACNGDGNSNKRLKHTLLIIDSKCGRFINKGDKHDNV